jgi:four helix bundle protein
VEGLGWEMVDKVGVIRWGKDEMERERWTKMDRRVKGDAMFSHERLEVYGKALGFASRAAGFIQTWDKRHAVADQFSRASESIPLNLAEAARLEGSSARLTILDYAIGSSLECAACLDIAHIKRLIEGPESKSEKHKLCEVTRMLFGLRRAWAESALKEEGPEYTGGEEEYLFHHERLEVYRRALSFMEWLGTVEEKFPAALLRKIDEGATSLVLNIAEGNGRYAELERQRFWKIAESAAVKMAVYLDLCAGKGVLGEKATGGGKGTLQAVERMLKGMR